MENEPTNRQSLVRTGIAATVLIAGLLHFALMQTHMEQARGSGLFFFTLGALQVAWALFYFREPTHNLERIGIAAAAIAPLLLWIMTRIFPAPFSSGPEHVDTFGVLTVLMEIAALVGLIWLDNGRSKSIAGKAVAIGVVITVFAYVGGAVAEEIPVLAEPELPHSHADDGHHDNSDGHHDADNMTMSADHPDDGHGH